MRKRKYVLFLIVLLLSISYVKSYADDISKYLILNDIPPYERYTQEYDPFTGELKTIPGYWIDRNAGVLMGSDHFLWDHMDVTYKTEYQSDTIDTGMKVQVTQHAGGDSDRWLLHEIDLEFRKFYGTPGDPYVMRVINGNTVIAYGSAGWVYRWLSNNVVVNIEYEDAQFNKPEPLEVVQAYLAKFPSTLPTITSAALRTADNEIKWIKDEIDRRLWLCDKWNLHYQAGKATQKDLIYNLVRSMKVFLNFRQKYFSVAAQADLDLLSGYQRNNDIASLQTKLSEYKGWWNSNKARAITLP